jgi:hypothetical protein
MPAPETIRQSHRLPRASKGQPLILRNAIQNILLGVAEGVMNLRVFQKQLDSSGNVIPAKQAEVKIADGSLDIILPAIILPAITGGGAGWDWMYAAHKELDPTLTYSAGKAAYVSPQSALATTGLMDLVAGVVTTVAPGTWLCVKNVPAQTTVAGVVKYNVPQPVPQLGAPAGSPLKGDADNANLFWIPLRTGGGCDSLGNVV